MQIWNLEGLMIFERPLNEKPIVCFMSEDAFVFKPHSNDQSLEEDDSQLIVNIYPERQEYYFVIFLKKNNREVKVNVKDQVFGQIAQPVIGFCNSCLYISN